MAALFGGLAGWLVVLTANAFDLVPPQVPWTAPAAVAVVAAAVGGLASATYQRIHVRREWMEPQRGVAFLVLGKASALGGAVLAGGYAAFAVMFLSRFAAEAPRERVVVAAVTVVTGIALTVAGLLLERACRVPKPGSDEDDPDDTATRS